MNCQDRSHDKTPQIRLADRLLARLLARARHCVRTAHPHLVLPRLDQYVVIDVREPAEALYAYLPFAINVPRGLLEFYFADHPEIPLRHEILVYSNNGRRSLLAAQTLGQLGFERVASLEGGIVKWSQLGLPVE